MLWNSDQSLNSLNEIKGTVSVILRKSTCKDCVTLRTVSLKVSCDLVWIRYPCFCVCKMFIFSDKSDLGIFRYKQQGRNSQIKHFSSKLTTISSTFWSYLGFKVSVVNRESSSFHRGSLKITLEALLALRWFFPVIIIFLIYSENQTLLVLIDREIYIIRIDR